MLHRYLCPCLILLALSSSACHTDVRDTKIENYLPIIASSLEGGSLALVLVGSEFRKNNNWTGCVGAKVISSAFLTASQVVRDPGGIFPGVSVDVSDCLNVRSDSVQVPDGAELKSLIISVVNSVLATVEYYVSQQKSSDCTAGQIGLAAIDYIRGAADPVISEITEFDGKIEIPPVKIDTSACP